MKKTLATIGATAAFAVTGFGLASVASAQTTDDGESQTDGDTETTETAPDEGRTDGRRGEGRGEGRSHGRGGCGSEAVAEMLGLEVDELRAQLEAGATLAEVAEANGVDADELVDQLVADATERIEDKVAEGRLSEDEAADKLADKAERIEDRVFGDSDSDSDEEGADSDA